MGLLFANIPVMLTRLAIGQHTLIVLLLLNDIVKLIILINYYIIPQWHSTYTVWRIRLIRPRLRSFPLLCTLLSVHTITYNIISNIAFQSLYNKIIHNIL